MSELKIDVKTIRSDMDAMRTKLASTSLSLCTLSDANQFNATSVSPNKNMFSYSVLSLQIGEMETSVKRLEVSLLEVQTSVRSIDREMLRKNGINGYYMSF